MSNGIVYLIQPCELKGTNRYKIGCSVKQGMKRIETGYKKGTRILRVIECDNSRKIESLLIKAFNNNFKLISGNEYFKGSEKKIINEFNKVIDNSLLVNRKDIIIKEILIENIEKNKNIKETNKKTQILKNFQEYLININNLKNNKITEFEKKLIIDVKILEKHLNLSLFIDINNNKKLEQINNNLFMKAFKNNYIKINICKELLNVLNINDITNLSRDNIKNFNDIVNNQWLNDNLNNIYKIFEIRTDKYTELKYYNIYLLLTTILKNLFDSNLFVRKQYNTQKNKNRFIYYLINENVLLEHKNIIEKINMN